MSGSSSRMTPRGGLILAAPASGSGKTLMTLGLLRLLRDRGVRVAAAKAGPDYIDPTFHAAASGGACLNLDAWAMRKATLAGAGRYAREPGRHRAVRRRHGPVRRHRPGRRGRLDRGAGAADRLAGRAGGRCAPAGRLGGGAGRRLRPARPGGAARRGHFQPGRRGAPPAMLETALARHLPELPCLGAVPQDTGLALPERHLGLVPAGEQQCGRGGDRARRRSRGGRSRCRAAVCAGPAGRRSRQTARTADPPCRRSAARSRWRATTRSCSPIRRAAAAGARPGAELSFFSPLADEAPDPAADAVYLPGGYPELHAGRLAASERFLGGLRRAAANGKAIYGECGGYMALGETLTAADGRVHRMAGLLPLATSFAERRLHLGYREATLLAAGPLGAAGTRFRGHEFHYATTVSAGEPRRSSRSPIPAAPISARPGCAAARSAARSST